MVSRRSSGPGPGRAPAIILGVLLSASFLFAFAGVIQEMVEEWSTSRMYSYGFLIPPISGYLVWIRRKELLGLRSSPSLLGGWALLLTGLGALFLGGLGGVIRAQMVALPVALLGTILLLLGRQALRRLFFPVAYLLLMLPIWDSFTDRFHMPFQLLSAKLGTRLLDAFGIPAFREGIHIQLPGSALEVAEGCSGLNYLIAVLAIGIPMAYLFLRSLWRRVLLVAFALCISILGNSLRVALIGAFHHYRLGDQVHGPGHVLQGVFVSILGYAALFGGLVLLSRSERAPPAQKVPPAPAPESGARRGRPAWALGAAAILLFLAVGGRLHLHSPQAIALREDLVAFPQVVGEWHGREAPVPAPIDRTMGTDREISRVYVDSSGHSVRLYVGYYLRQEQGREVVHWTLRRLHRAGARLREEGPRGLVDLNRVLDKNADPSRLVIFWYDLNGRIVASPYLAKLHTILDALARDRTNGALVMVICDPPGQELNGADVPPEVRVFLREVLRLLPDYLPG